MPKFSILRRSAAAALGLSVWLLPAAALGRTPDMPPLSASSAPSPQEIRLAAAAPYLTAVGQLTALGVDRQTANLLWTRLGPETTAWLAAGRLDSQTLELLSLPWCRMEELPRYQAYLLRCPELSCSEATLQVNLGLDQPFYEGVQSLADPADPLVLVNKYNALPADYVPPLAKLPAAYGSGSLTPETAAAFMQMADAARLDGVSLYSVSAYRSYRTQSAIYRRNVEQVGQRWADTYSARPGHSEHQTGLALDINAASTSAHFEDTEAFAWLQSHCAQYGFLLRYPRGQEAVTGYCFEPWHYRYVGREIAVLCTEQGLTYDEYVARLPAAASYPLPGGSLA